MIITLFLFQVNSAFNELVVDKLRYLGPTELTQYYVKDTNMTRIISGDSTAIIGKDFKNEIVLSGSEPLPNHSPNLLFPPLGVEMAYQFCSMEIPNNY